MTRGGIKNCFFFFFLCTIIEYRKITQKQKYKNKISTDRKNTYLSSSSCVIFMILLHHCENNPKPETSETLTQELD